jgi:hypothetical protein
MNNQLAQLISDYQTSVRTALHLMKQSGIPLPSTCLDWVETDIPPCGELKGGFSYYKHGFGCAVGLPAGEIDFDFGDKGEIDGFDSWRLLNFAGSRLGDYGFDTEDALEESFQAAVKSGSLAYSGNTLYYVTDSVRSLSAESLEILQSDRLPHRARDSVLRLYATCHLSGDLMREHYVKVDHKLKKNGHLSQNDQVKFRTYLLSWLGYLRATWEGFEKLSMRLLLQNKRPEDFRELIPKFDAIGRIQKLHKDELRELRNSVFHLSDDNKTIDRFFANDAKRLAWAGELHAAIAEFLSAYRVLCEVHYFMHDRISESHIPQQRVKRCKKTVA